MLSEFYIVWKRGGNSPVRVHDTYIDALNEAKRLANMNPDTEFIVLTGMTGIVAMSKPCHINYYQQQQQPF